MGFHDNNQKQFHVYMWSCVLTLFFGSHSKAPSSPVPPPVGASISCPVQPWLLSFPPWKPWRPAWRSPWIPSRPPRWSPRKTPASLPCQRMMEPSHFGHCCVFAAAPRDAPVGFGGGTFGCSHTARCAWHHGGQASWRMAWRSTSPSPWRPKCQRWRPWREPKKHCPKPCPRWRSRKPWKPRRPWRPWSDSEDLGLHQRIPSQFVCVKKCIAAGMGWGGHDSHHGFPYVHVVCAHCFSRIIILQPMYGFPSSRSQKSPWLPISAYCFFSSTYTGYWWVRTCGPGWVRTCWGLVLSLVSTVWSAYGELARIATWVRSFGTWDLPKLPTHVRWTRSETWMQVWKNTLINDRDFMFCDSSKGWWDRTWQIVLEKTSPISHAFSGPSFCLVTHMCH